MRVSRVYYQQTFTIGQTFEVTGKLHHYLVNVLRLKVGHQVRFFDGVGREFECKMTASDRHTSQFVCDEELDALAELELPIDLYLAVSKNESMDFSIQKATELGVRGIHPVISERSLPLLTAQQRVVHWRGVVRSACEQCGRAVLAEVAEPIALAAVPAVATSSKAVLFCRDAEHSLPTVLNTTPMKPSIILIIGPEGGWSHAEKEALSALGFERAHLGARSLRSETAVVNAISSTLYAYQERAAL